MAEYEEKEALGEIMPWEKDIIPQYEKVKARLDRLLENPKEIIQDDGNILEASHINMTGSDSHPAVYEDPFLKFKEHEREQRRERRVKN